MRRPPHLPTRTLKVDTEALKEFNHICSPDGVSDTLLSRFHPGSSSSVGKRGRVQCTLQGQQGEEPLAAQVQSESQPQSWPPNNLLQQVFQVHKA